MEKKWHYAIDKKPVGPVDDKEFLQLIDNGSIMAETLVWQPGMKEWKPLSDIQLPEPEKEEITGEKVEPDASLGSLTAEETAEEIEAEYEAIDNSKACYQCGKQFPRSELILHDEHLICPACSSSLYEETSEKAKPVVEMIYADFWIRAGAKIIDILILWSIGLLVTLLMGFFVNPLQYPEDSMVFPLLVNMLQLIIAVSYTTYFLGKYAATPGKMVCHLKVVSPAGEKISYHQACLRYFAEIVSSLIFCIGYLMAVFDAERRTLHDRIAGTRVIKIPQQVS